MTKPLSLFRVSRAISLIALCSTSWVAQGADSTTPSYLPSSSEVVQLSELKVNGESGDQTYFVQRSATGTKTDTALVDIPQSISVVTRELIDDQSMRSIGDLTRYVPGVGIAQGEGNRDTPVMRGNSTTADFFIDGVRDDVQYFRDFYNTDRVEVLKGPNAMIFGRGGSGGVINRVTKQANGTTVRELTLQAGSWEQYRATLDVAQPIDDSVSFRITGVYEDANSYREDVSLKRYGINPTVAWHVSPNTKLVAGYEHFHDQRVADRGVSSFRGRPVAATPSTYFGSPEQSPVTATVNSAFATLTHSFGGGVRLRNTTRFGHYDKFYQNVFPGAVDPTGTNVTLAAYNNATERENIYNQTDLIVPFSTGSVSHQFLTGLELGRQETDNRRQTGYFETVAPGTTSILVPLSNPRTTLPVTFALSATDAVNHGIAETAAVYAQDQITLLPQLQAIVGVRIENFEVDFLNRRTGAWLNNEETLVSPRAGLVYKPAPNVSLYTSYSTSYIPRAGEQLSSLSLTNRSLDPETFKNYEIGAKWDIRSDLAFTAATYRLDRSNVAIVDPADSTKSILVDGQRAYGLELGLTGRLAKSWSISGGYAYQDGEIRTTQSATVLAGARLAQLPRHTFSLWNRYDFNAQWGVGLGAIYRDEIFTSTDNTVRLPSFVRFDAAIFYRINENLRAQLNVENLLDRDYYASAHSNNNITPGSPLAVRVTLTTRF